MTAENQYIEKIIAQMINYAQLNFEEKLDISDIEDNDGFVSGLAVSVNMLGEEMHYQVQQLQELNMELRSKNSFIRSVTNAVPEIIFVHSTATNNLSYVNKCFSSSRHYPCPVVLLGIRQPCHHCTVPEEITDQSGNRHFTNEEGEFRMDNLNGKTRWFRSSVNPFEKNTEGEHISFLYTLTDITLLKENEIQLLKKEEAITQSLREKELLLQEVHHRVKNNLQIVSGLLSMKARNSFSADVKRELQEIRSRVLTISLIHEGLYQSNDLARIDLSNYCITLCNQLKQVYCQQEQDIEVVYDIEPGIFRDISKATPFGLIVNEIICNSFKHAFNGRRVGRIEVTLCHSDNSIVLGIRDDGNGPTGENRDSERRTLGNKLIQALSRQLGGTLQTQVRNGYLVQLRIPEEGESVRDRKKSQIHDNL